MHVFGFGAAQGRHATEYGSDFTISRLAHTHGIHVGCMRLGAGGVVGYHRAGTHQVLAVVEGTRWSRGESPERTPIAVGTAVYWQPGEWHETGTDAGLVATCWEASRRRSVRCRPADSPVAAGPLPASAGPASR